MTTDGGAHWTVQKPHVVRDGNLYGVSFVDDHHGWVAGYQGELFYTCTA
ncbi:MAG TPA: hypothetical protein VHW04_11840 [Solirubrobacteraceae bacterium]|nr:hypothetical protein [Solirubrobacteraceae bacterium]